MKTAKIGLPKGSGKRLKVREKSVKSQGILKWILSGKPYNNLKGIEHRASCKHIFSPYIHPQPVCWIKR